MYSTHDMLGGIKVSLQAGLEWEEHRDQKGGKQPEYQG